MFRYCIAVVRLFFNFYCHCLRNFQDKMRKCFDDISALMSPSQQVRWEGWATEVKAHYLMMSVFTIRPAIAVEIGVWAGRSCIPIAMAMKECGRGVVHAIDPWSPDASAEGYDEKNAEWWKVIANHHYAFKQFSQAIIATQTTAHIEIHKCKSDDWMPPDQIDLLHIDGQHTPQAIKDAERYASKVRVGGIVCMDDVHWHNGSNYDVLTAVNKLKEMGFVDLFSLNNKEAGDDCAFFQRIMK